MTTPSNSPGTLPPIPSPPPDIISVRTSNDDVKLWVYHRLRKMDSSLSDSEAWTLARRVKGDGRAVLCYGKDGWEKQLSEWGEVIYISIQQSQTYVMDTVFTFFLVGQTLLLLIAGGSGTLQVLRKEDFHRTRTIGIVFLAYTAALKALQTILSSKWVYESNRISRSLKLKPREDSSLWTDFAGIPK